jgi:hypothetical protein
MIQDLTNQPQSNYQIDTLSSIQDKILDILEGIEPSLQLYYLEKVAMGIRKINSERLYSESMKFARKHPKIKEESNSYKFNG